MSPSIAYCWVWNAIPDLAIQLPKAVLVRGSRITLPHPSHKLCVSYLFWYPWGIESLVFEPPTEVSGLFLETPNDSQAFAHMTRIHPHVSYKYLVTHPQNTTLLLVALKPRTSHCLTKCNNLSIHINSLCNTLISIIHVKIALCSQTKFLTNIVG